MQPSFCLIDNEANLDEDSSKTNAAKGKSESSKHIRQLCDEPEMSPSRSQVFFASSTRIKELTSRYESNGHGQSMLMVFPSFVGDIGIAIKILALEALK